MDPIVGTAMVLGGKLAYDVLGPTAKLLGSDFKGLAQSGIENVERVFRSAKENAPPLEQGQFVPPRFLPAILKSGYFFKDELVTAYLGGLLASSRTRISRDDRASWEGCGRVGRGTGREID